MRCNMDRLEELKCGVYKYKKGKALIKVYMWTESGTVFFHRRRYTDWAHTIDSMNVDVLMRDWQLLEG